AVEVDAGRLVQPDDDLERVVRPARLLERLLQPPDVVNGLVPRVGVADPTVAEAGRTPQRWSCVTAAVDGNGRRRVRLHREGGDVVVGPMPLHPTALPQFAQSLD